MGPFSVIVLDVFSNQVVEVLLAKDEEVVEALYLNRLNEPLNVGDCPS
jgi:hypothetical protein